MKTTPPTDDDSETWDSLRMVEGTVRPISSQRNANLSPRAKPNKSRCRSAMNIREIIRPESSMSSTSKTSSEITKFHKSLKLLGITDDATNIMYPGKSNFSEVKPKVITRLSTRSISTQDIKAALNSNGSGPSKALLNRAIYEEWYFVKTKEAQAKAAAELKKEYAKSQRVAEINVLKESKCKENFDNWLKRKANEKKFQQEKAAAVAIEKSKKEPMIVRRNVSKEAAAEAYNKWLEKKSTQAPPSKRLTRSNQELSSISKQRDIDERNVTFETWKSKADQARKEALIKMKRKSEAELKAKEEKAKQAEASYRAWKSMKEIEMKEEEERSRRHERYIQTKEATKAARRKQKSQVAFEDWIGKVVERESAEKRML